MRQEEERWEKYKTWMATPPGVRPGDDELEVLHVAYNNCCGFAIDKRVVEDM